MPSEKEVETVVPPTLIDTRPRLEPLPRLEEEGADEALPTDDVARTSSPVGFSGTAAQSPVLISGRLTTSPLFGFYLKRGDKEAALGYRDFLVGLEELKALPLEDRRQHLKNEVFRVRIIVLLYRFVLYLLSNLFLF